MFAEPGQLGRRLCRGADELVQTCLQPAAAALSSGQELLTTTCAARESGRLAGAGRASNHTFIGDECKDPGFPARGALSWVSPEGAVTDIADLHTEQGVQPHG